MTEIKSSFSCECCHQPAIFYSFAGEFKHSYRCHNHKPSFIREVPDPERIGHSKTKHWIACATGITLGMQQSIEKSFEKKNIN